MLHSFESLVNWFQRMFPPPAVAAIPATAPRSSATALDVSHVEELVNRATELTSIVARDVGQHTVDVQAISAELMAVAQNDPSAVAAIVCKLLLANQNLQSRLERAEQTLQSHSQQLRDAVTSSRTDALTGLLNRRALDEELRRSLAAARPGSRAPVLMLLDVDRFKQLNDTYGHLAGDQVLLEIADKLRQESRSADLVARFGGEEFVVAFNDTSLEDARRLAETLRSSLGRHPVTYEQRCIKVSASAGLAAATAGDTVADWIKRADEALYAAKRAGRDCAFEYGACGCVRLEILGDDAKPSPAAESTPRPAADFAAELAAEAFDDTTFVPGIARRIAEWRRGGATLTVLLARLDQPESDESPDEQTLRSAIRLALQLARACVREMDLVTRWQGDGLAFLLPSTSTAEARLFARRLRAAYETANATLSDNLPRLSMSMGIAEGIEGNDANRVLERAWLALDAARLAGPATTCLHDGLKTVIIKPITGARCS